MLTPWEERAEVKKGDLGLSVVRDMLLQHGYFPYRPDFDGRHPIDRVAFNPRSGEIILYDAKCKAARYRFPDTGFDLTHYEEYRGWNEKSMLRVFVAWVDEEWNKVYGNFLDTLTIPQGKRGLLAGHYTHEYPLIERGIIYFPLENMRLLGEMNGELCAEIHSHRRTNHETRSFDYDFPEIPRFSVDGAK